MEFVLGELRVQWNECRACRDTEVAEGHLGATGQHHSHAIAACDPKAMQGGPDCHEMWWHVRKSKRRPTRRNDRLHVTRGGREPREQPPEVARLLVTHACTSPLRIAHPSRGICLEVTSQTRRDSSGITRQLLDDARCQTPPETSRHAALAGCLVRSQHADERRDMARKLLQYYAFSLTSRIPKRDNVSNLYILVSWTTV